MSNLNIAIGGEYPDYGENWIYDYCSGISDPISSSFVLTEVVAPPTGAYVLVQADSTNVLTETYVASASFLPLPYFLLAPYVFAVENAAPTGSTEFSLALEQGCYDVANVEEGIKIDKFILFNSINEQRNVDESFKRVVYNQNKNLYYPDIKDPTKMLGLDNLDVLLDNKNRVIYDTFKVVTLPTLYYGDRIEENSVLINENGLVSYSIIDDGYGNLKARDEMFSFFASADKTIPTSSIGNVITNRNRGYSVAINDRYALSGNPSFESVNYYTGSVDVYKYDSQLSNRFIKSGTLRRTAFKTGTYLSASIISDFGRAVDINDNIAAVSSNYFKYDSNASSGNIDTFGCIELYDLNTSYTTASRIISSSIIPITYETGSGSFGWSISLNDQFLAVGCPHTYGYKGSVYMLSGSASTGYIFHSQLTGSVAANNVLFGKCLKLDKNYNKLIVGNGDYTIGSGSVYLFELSGSVWTQTYKFDPTKTSEDLNFLPIAPYSTTLNEIDGFGTSVSIYCSSSNDIKVAIGAPFDRIVYEFSGSGCYRNGAVYIYEKERCDYSASYSGSIISASSAFVFNQTRISGDSDAFKQNRFGHSVDIWDNKVLCSCPKYFSENTTQYIYNTFLYPFDFDASEEVSKVGIFYVYEKSDSSWDVFAKHKVNKIYAYPYNFYGWDVALHDSNIIVGNPIVLTDYNNSSPIVIGDNEISFLKDLCGDFNIFDLDDYTQIHYIGNVFYKTGKMIVSTTASIFDTIFESPVNIYPKYDITFNNRIKLYQKEIICTVNPGEFNYSTNPTSYTFEPYSNFDLNKNGKFDFDDCDKLLRVIYYKFNGNEQWWQHFKYTDSNNILIIDRGLSTTEDIVAYSIFKFYSKNSSPPLSRLTSNEIDSMIDLYDSLLDINGDGVADYLDMSLLWMYFTDTLNINTYEAYQNQKSLISDRNSFDLIYEYLKQETGRGKNGTILSTFYSGSNMTSPLSSSYLVPYITTIGLYNGADLIGVAKLGTPIRNQGIFPLNFVIRFDI
jgi:hypothetical protein